MRTRRQKILDDAISRQKSQSLSLVNGSGNSELLPIDLIIEILSRLPVKSIARYRCVSKLWSSTILRSEFTDLVMKRSATTQPQLLLACKRQREVLLYSSPQPQTPKEESSHVVAANHHMSFPLSCGGGYVLNSVHGLVCLQKNTKKDKVLVICNPSTGQSLTLPKVKTQRIDVKSFFGYDPVGKHFKLLSMSIPRYNRRNTLAVSGEHQVLTLGNGKPSWRMIECNIPHYPLFGDEICINGVLYYQAEVIGFEGKSMIASFDIRSEKFKFIKGEKQDWRPTLVNYKGQLATLRSDYSCHAVYAGSRSIQFCVLKDAQKHEWSTYIHVLPLLSTYIASPYGMTIEGVTTTGEIVLSSHHQSYPFYFLYYNLERKTIRKVEVQGMDIYKYYGVRTFIDHVEDVKIGGVFQTS